MKPEIKKVIDGVNQERAYQDIKHSAHVNHTVGEWLLIMQSELDEAKQGWVKGIEDSEALCEILQVVSVGFACLEQHGVVFRLIPPHMKAEVLENIEERCL